MKGTHLAAMLVWLPKLLDLQGRIKGEKPVAAHDKNVDS